MFTTMSEAIEAYDDMLDETAPHVITAGGIDFLPSDVLRQMDPVAYRVGFHDWLDSEGVDSDDLEDDADLP